MALPTVTSPGTSVTTGRNAKVYIKVGTTSPTATDLVPDITELSLTINGQAVNMEIYGSSVWSRSDKTGLSGQLNFKTVAFGNNTVVAPLITAALASGTSAKALFILENADGSYFSGQVSITVVTPENPVGGAFAYAFQCSSDGAIAYQAPA
jgi:hypothetical protein